MKVLYVVDGQGGGAVTHILELAGGLRKEGIGAEILFFSDGPSPAEAARRGIPSHRIVKREWGMMVFLWRLIRHVRRGGYDLLHSHTINGNFFSRIAGRAAGIPVLTTVHSYIIDEMKGLTHPSMGDRVRYRLDLAMAEWVQGLVAVSPGLRERLLSHGIPEEKIRVIPNGIDLDRFRPERQEGVDLEKAFGIRPGEAVVAIVARLVPLKDHATFLAAARRVVDAFPQVKFLVIGDGPLRGELERKARDLGIADRTVFAGWRGDVDRILPKIDVGVLCSRTEGHGVAVLEAMACGKPVVGTDVPEINQTISAGENGLLVPPGDPEALSGAITDLLRHPSKRTEMGRKARRHVEKNYSVEKMVQDYDEFYRESLA